MLAALQLAASPPTSAALHCPHFRLWVFRCLTLPEFQALGLPLPYIARISGFGSSDELHCPHFRLWVFRCFILPAFQALGLPTRYIARISGFGSSDALHCPHFRLWVFRCLALRALCELRRGGWTAQPKGTQVRTIEVKRDGTHTA